MKKVVLCGGGTGGHVFPSIAVAEILKKNNCDLFYIGVKGKVEEKIADENGIEFYGYEFLGFPRKLQRDLFTWPFKLLKAISQAKVYLRYFKPDIIFGTGGYSSAPVFIAAKRMGIPYIIHNLDVRLGLANKFCAQDSKLITLGFKPEHTLLKNKEMIVTGNPVRRAFLDIQKIDNLPLYKEFGFSPEKKVVFVLGGSQGANAINEMILEISKDLVLNHDVQIIHQTGELTHEAFEKRIPAKVHESKNYFVKSFFDNPERCYHVADLVISRAGAMTTTEITVMGKPAIFIPFPYAGNHQEANIKHLVNAGCAMLFRQKDLQSKQLLGTIIELLNDEKKLKNMSEITSSFSKPNAAEDIAKIILSKIENENDSQSRGMVTMPLLM